MTLLDDGESPQLTALSLPLQRWEFHSHAFPLLLLWELQNPGIPYRMQARIRMTQSSRISLLNATVEFRYSKPGSIWLTKAKEIVT